MVRSKLKFVLAAVVVLGGIVGTATAVLMQKPQGEPAQERRNPKVASRKARAAKPLPKDIARAAEPSVRLGSSQFRYGGRISSLEYSSDGKRLLSAGGVWGAAVWVAKTGELIRHFPGVSTWTTADFSPDGKRVALAGYFEGSVSIWDVDSGKEVCAVKGGSRAARFTSDGKTLFTLAGLRAVSGFDSASGKRRQVIVAKEQMIGASMIATSPTGSLVAANTARGELRVWDWKAGRQLGQTNGVATGIHNAKDLEFTPDGKSLIVLGGQKDTELRDARKLTVIRRFSTGFRSSSLGVSGDGKRVAVGGYRGMVAIFDSKTGEEIASWKGHSDHISAVALSPNGKHLACATDINGDVKIWDVATTKELFPKTGHGATIGGLAVLKDGSLVSRDHRWTFARWDLTTGKATRHWQWEWPRFMSVKWAYSPQANRTLIGNQSLYVGVDPGDPKETFADVFTKAIPPNGKERIEEIAMSADGRFGAVATRDDRVCICDLDRLAHVRTFTLPKVRHLAWTRHYSLALSPDGGLLAGASKDKVQLWEVKTGPVLPSPKVGFSLTELMFSPDGKTLALAGGQKVILWDVKSGKTLSVLSVQRSRFQTIAFSPNSKTLATGPTDPWSVVRLWEVASGREIRKLGGARGGAASLAFSPDGKTLYAGTGSSLIVGWLLDRGSDRAPR